jgi:hypothetical protein
LGTDARLTDEQFQAAFIGKSVEIADRFVKKSLNP